MRQPAPGDEVILDLVAMVPPGVLTTYGHLASLAGDLGPAATPRRVARTLSCFGSAVPWWRVVRSDGRIAEQVLAEAAPRLAAEGVVVTQGRVPLADRRWVPDIRLLREELERRNRASMDP